jgi:hypothetical protein
VNGVVGRVVAESMCDLSAGVSAPVVAGQWVFDARKPGSVIPMPKGKEYFQGDASNQLVTSCMREVFQNSQDARAEDAVGPVLIRISRVEFDAQSYNSMFMRGMDKNLGAVMAAAAKVRGNMFSGLDLGKSVKTLLVEDYNTTGLTGRVDLEPAEEPENFSSFWLNHGTSTKSKGNGGRHGTGKLTLTELSESRTITAATWRADSPELVAYGQATFLPHRVDGVTYDAYGMFGREQDGSAYPLVGEDAVRFCAAVGFDRVGKRGLSVMIPHVKEEVTDEAMIVAIIRCAYFQICMGLVSAEVCGTVIDENTIAELAARHDDTRDLLSAISLASDARGDGAPFRARKVEIGNASIAETAFDDDELSRLRDLAESGGLVDIRFEVPVKKVREQVGYGIGRLVLRKTADGSKGVEVFTRGAVTVSQARGNSRYDAIFMTPYDDVLSEFLGDAEDVSHTAWHASRAKSNGYAQTYTEQTLDRVRKCVQHALALITGVEQEREIKDAFLDYFYVTRVEEKPQPKPKKIEQAAEADDMPELPAQPAKPLVLTRIERGFRLTRDPRREGEFSGAVTCYYSTASGKPSYSELDFNLAKAPIKIVADDGVVYSVTAGNALRIPVFPAGSSITVSGFDVNRELTIKFGHSEKD